MSDSLQPHVLQHARPPCPSPTPGVYSNSCPLSRWCHPTISSSVIPFSSCLNLSHHQDLFQWVSSSHQMAKVLEFKINLNQNVRILDIQLVLREGLYIVQWEARETFSSGCSKPNCAGSCLFYLNILPVLSKPVLKLLLHAKSESEKRICFIVTRK